MKKILNAVFCSMLLFVMANTVKAQETTTTITEEEDVEQWKVPDGEAAKMMGYFRSCKENCKKSKVFKDQKKEDAIRKKFPDLKSIEWVSARYRRADAERYSKKNKKKLTDPDNQISGYTTQLMKVVTAENSVMYFDVATICPPPSNCDGLEVELQ